MNVWLIASDESGPKALFLFPVIEREGLGKMKMKARVKSEDALVWFGPEALTLPSSVVFPWIGHVCARTRAQWEIGLTRVALSCEDRLVSLVSRGHPEATTLHTDNRWIERLGPTGVLLVVYLTLSIALIMDDWSVGTGEWFTLCLPLFRDGSRYHG